MIIFLIREDCNSLPPFLSLIKTLKIEYSIISQYDPKSIYKIPFIKIRYIDKIIFKIYTFIHLYKSHNSSIYIIGGDTFVSLHKSILRKSSLIMYEVHDRHPNIFNSFRINLSLVKRIIVPSETRKYLISGLYNVDIDKFDVIFNYSVTEIYKELIPFNINQLINDFIIWKKNRIAIIYQGVIDNKSRDLDLFINYISNNPKFCGLIMGSGNLIHNLPSKNFFRINYVNPPFHLEFTKLCEIGFLTYTLNSLNSNFAAPNKVWEYSKFGLPMIVNYNPGIFEWSVDNRGIIFVDSISSIEEKIKYIMNNYNYLSKCSLNFYNNYNFELVVNNVIK